MNSEYDSVPTQSQQMYVICFCSNVNVPLNVEHVAAAQWLALQKPLTALQCFFWSGFINIFYGNVVG